MNMIRRLENNFKIQRGASSSITIEENNAILLKPQQIRDIVEYFIKEARKRGLENLYFEISSQSPNYNTYQTCFQENGFIYSSERIVVFKDIFSVVETDDLFDLTTIEEIGEESFREVWNETIKNATEIKGSMPFEVCKSMMQKEMGDRWKEHCLIALLDKEPIGIIIPYIEPGTLEEGKLFHFGIVPSMRGKGYESKLLEKAMYILKEIGAAYYIGTTDRENEWMKSIFEQNAYQQLSCIERYTKAVKQG
ncbi:GNAT family N-acetyltransferase [Bacillus gaemokensis]|uniref:Acetyltransferase n=1 Tax=Bacillus gaemokensis TaxID=574375 RepID=A0A073K9S0_9BACI|nr:GNAT family N-acetyltransferase [Bacillus gaemokensis]KEK23286.1 acetyltransferase [Bacillus gaemokensis]KYG28966.1 acetyltransferase [Bacillus gaemokensis]